MVKSSGVQRESDGVVVPLIAVRNAAGGKGPDFGRADQAGKREGMTGSAWSNYPGSPQAVVALDGKPSGVKVRELQRRLWTAAKQHEGRRFHALYDRVHRGDVLWEAWRRVRANRGAAGVDRVTLAFVENEYGVRRNARRTPSRPPVRFVSSRASQACGHSETSRRCPTVGDSHGA